MPLIKAVIFDFIGTLTSIKGYNMEDSKNKLCKAILGAGFHISSDNFLKAYEQAHEKYRTIRYQQLVEVTNAIWISDALNNLGIKTGPQDTRIKTAVNIFFQDYIKSTTRRPCARKLLKETSANHKLGLISNFTYAPVIHTLLRRLDINQYFNTILISQETGWRKPHPRIFQMALQKLETKPEETVYVGDNPTEDIKGAKTQGMKTVFVASQFYSNNDLTESQQKPNLTANGICELCKTLPKLFCNEVRQ